MNLSLLEGLGWLLLCLLPFLLVQRWLHLRIQAVFLLITRRADLSLGLFSLIFFPGVVLHEISHYLAARLLGVKTGRFSLLPHVLPDGRLRLGYVETVRTDILRDALIGTAPLISGGLAVAYLGISRLGLLPLATAASQGSWQLFFQKLAGVPQQPDFWLWFYLAFTISSVMMPSASDRRAWLPIILILAALLGVAAVAGAGEWMLAHLAPWLNGVFNSLALIFAISLAVHLVLAVPIGLAYLVLSKMTGLEVK